MGRKSDRERNPKRSSFFENFQQLFRRNLKIFEQISGKLTYVFERVTFVNYFGSIQSLSVHR